MAITMKNLNDRTSALEGKASTTPITMKGLSDRLDNIESTAKQWEIVTCSLNNNTGTLSKNYTGWNYTLLSATAIYERSNSEGAITRGTGSISNNGKTLSGSGNGESASGTLSVNGTTVKFTSPKMQKQTITILFYK